MAAKEDERSLLNPNSPINPDDARHFLQVPEPSYRVRFQDSPEIQRRAGRRRSISMPTGLNLLLQLAEYSCQPKPGAEKDYFDEVEEQQIYRSNSNTAGSRPGLGPSLDQSDYEADDDEIEDADNMSTTGDELSEIESPSADPPPPYPGTKHSSNGQNRKRQRFQNAKTDGHDDYDDLGLEEEFTKKPLATRRKSGGVLPLKVINSNYLKSNGPDDTTSDTRSNASGQSGGGISNIIRGKLNYISNTIPTKFKMRKRTPDEYKLQIFVSLLFLVIILLIGGIYVIHQEKELQKAYFHRIRFSSKDRKFRLSNLKGTEVLAGILGTSLTSKDKAWPCLKIHQRESESCLEWMDKARLYFRRIPLPTSKDPTSTLNPSLDNQPSSEETQQCYGTLWESLSPNFIPMDCFYTNENRGFHFYGGGEQELNQWPLNRTVVPLAPFVTGNKLDGRRRQSPNSFQWGRFLKRQFFGSPGISVDIWKSVPLHISINSVQYPGMVCFAAKRDLFAYPTLPAGTNMILNYTMCTGDDIQEVTAASQLISARDNLEDLRHEDVLNTRKLVKTPIWRVLPSIFSSDSFSNSNSSHVNNEKQLLDHADRIKAESLSEDNILLLDESFEKYLGDFEIDSERFPTIIQTLNYTQRRGFQIAFTVQPYFSTESKNYIDGLEKDLWVKEKSAAASASMITNNNNRIRKVPALVQYKNSYSSVLLDVTKLKARTWFEEKVRSVVRKYSINAIFIELGSTIDLPQYYEFHQDLENPDDYKQSFIQTIRKGVGLINTISVSSSIKSPKLPTFISLSPIESSWNGLQSIIPNLLTLGISGFSFIMTGPIGGSYKSTSQLNSISASVFEANKPERNLYIRWLELTYFLPIVQYTYLPSDYDPGVLQIAKSLKVLREAKVQTIIKKAVDESLKQGKPVIQPLWMIDPNDINCLVVSDQYSIGGQIIVAPILTFNATERDIYLPKGKWKDELDGSTTKGEKWLNRYRVKENQIAFFTKMADSFS